MHILIQIRPAPDVTSAVVSSPGKQTVADVVGDLPGVAVDPEYSPVAVPRPVSRVARANPLSMRQPLSFSYEAEDASVLVRGQVSDDELGTTLAMLAATRTDIVGVFADAGIQAGPVCGEPPIGTWEDVADKLHTADLHAENLDARDVTVAVVDNGINVERLRQLRGDVHLDETRSWSPPSVPHVPGRFPVDHGTMCAFDLLIAAPQAQLLDMPVLRTRESGQTVMEGYLSDAYKAYDHLRLILEATPESSRHLIVSNSWQCYSPRWDFGSSHPGNYSDNLAHPFNVAVANLESLGADVLFVAGNCGRDCPDSRCGYDGELPIGGANSHPQALCIAGVDIKDDRVGYSSQGPGRLARHKPDVCGYTHFRGSEVYGVGSADSGTSAACPVAAGVVAALRTAWSAAQVSPEQLRTVLQRTAADRSGLGFSDDYGFGVINVPQALAMLQRQ
ncbi:S8 family serine peptidase [Streptomyces sp. NPDC096033]|uniref:S8 family serine peptidase n=1 Tax=Streptomyces sp. NPDC096033 TaxID=3366071 RepID=UPI003828212A